MAEVSEVAGHEHRAEKASAAVLDRVRDEQVFRRRVGAVARPGCLDRHRAGALAPGERLVDQVAHHRVAAVLLEQRLHRRVGEDHLARGREERHRVLEVLHHRFEIGGRARQRLLAHRRQLRAHRFERAAEIAELLTGEIERYVQLAASEARQSALDHVDRPQHPLGEDDGDERGEDERREDAAADRTKRLPQLVLDEDHRHADADRPELLVARQQLLANLEGLVGRYDGLQLIERTRIEQRRELRLLGDALPFLRLKAVRDRNAVDVDDRRIGDVGLERDGRRQDRADAAVVAQRLPQIRPRRGHDLSRALEHGVGQHLAAQVGLFETAADERRHMVGAEDGDDHHHEGGDAGHLFGFDRHRLSMPNAKCQMRNAQVRHPAFCIHH